MNNQINQQDEEDEEISLFEHHRIIIDNGQEALRIDKFLMDRIANVTRNRLQNAIDSEFIRVNDKPVKANYKVRPADVITILMPEPPREDLVLPENIPLNIVYEDNSLLIVNKEAGMVVHPAHSNWSGTLVNALAYHLQNLPTSQNGTGRPGLVHRIDKDTSGLLVIAKTETVMSHLAKQFYDHSIERTYYALVWGEVKEDVGRIENYLGRSMKDRRIVEVYEDETQGKKAITHYEVLKRMRYVTLIKCNLETGRTHQIRAHMKHLGHPLFNDAMYGGDKVLKGTNFTKYKQFVENCFKMMPRQALHAKSLGFIHPDTDKNIFFEADLPADFAAVLDKWEKYVVE